MSWMFVEFKFIHASVQETSSSVRLSVGLSLLSGGSMELQVAKNKGRIKKFSKNSLRATGYPNNIINSILIAYNIYIYKNKKQGGKK